MALINHKGRPVIRSFTNKEGEKKKLAKVSRIQNRERGLGGCGGKEMTIVNFGYAGGGGGGEGASA